MLLSMPMLIGEPQRSDADERGSRFLNYARMAFEGSAAL